MLTAIFMMKSTILTLIALILSTLTYAQKSLLALNEQNKYTYFSVKPVKAHIDAEALTAYMKNNITGIKDISVTKDTKGVAAAGGMIVYRQGLVTGQEEGEITYKLNIDFKDNRYRLIVTDFVFTPFKRNRYGVFAPAEGVEIALESSEGRITQKQLNSYLDKLGSYYANLSKQVDNYMTKPDAANENPAGLKKVDTKSW
jgi:hypothetical protein